MISAALFTLTVVALALGEGLPLWYGGSRREAVTAWALWAVGLILGNLLILMDPPPYLAPFLDDLLLPIRRLLTGE